MYNRLLACYNMSITFMEYDDIKRNGVYFARYGLSSTVLVPDDKVVGEINEWFGEAEVL